MVGRSALTKMKPPATLFLLTKMLRPHLSITGDLVLAKVNSWQQLSLVGFGQIRPHVTIFVFLLTK